MLKVVITTIQFFYFYLRTGIRPLAGNGTFNFGTLPDFIENF